MTSGGFGCTSCHQIGSALPHKVELKSHGTDLTLLGKRIRRTWYDRWMHNPARIVPRMEMPALVAPIRGVLGNDLEDQLAAVWHVVNLPGFNPPRPNPVRVVRSHNLPNRQEPANIVTDVIEVDSEQFIKPWLVGLANRHNVFFDLETATLRRWYSGDTASQHTRGKSWYWEASGTAFYDRGVTPSEWQLLRDGKLVPPQNPGQFATEADWFETTGEQAQLAIRLKFPTATGPESDTPQLRVTQTFQPAQDLTDAATSGFERIVELQGIHNREPWQVAWQVVPSELIQQAQGNHLQLRHAPGVSYLEISRWEQGGDSGKWQPVACEQGAVRVIVPQGNTGVRYRVVYATEVPVDQFFAQPQPAPPAFVEELNVVPGYRTQVLPLSGEVMPTGLAWQPDGTLILASLKGRVWLASDSDGDGLEDSFRPFSQELASPYGVASANEPGTKGAVDVITKYGLLRLLDQDGDGHAERTVTLASGWGHTADYHDWAVGLPRTADGVYWIGLPCQQDARSEAGAHLRGHALRLVPRSPTPADPRGYAVEDYCAGLRFPMGLAINRDGIFVASDNQGNYNPFNELNHLLPGKRYGFINKLERSPGVSAAGDPCRHGNPTSLDSQRQRPDFS